MSLNRIPSFDVSRVLLFDVNRVLLFDMNRLFSWRIPPLMLVGLAGWFVAGVGLDLGILSLPLARVVAAASAGLFILSLVHRLRAQRLPAASTKL